MVFMLCGSFVLAQTTVTGTVSDASGPLPGVNIIVKGTTTGTQSDFDGNYTLDVSEDAILVFSFLGYQTQEIPVQGRTTINVTMAEDAAVLDEVVVIGYGTQAVKDATGAVDVVSSENFQKGVISSPEQLIQGKTAGVQITQASGEPGAGVNIRIRGTASVRSNNNPLFVVDGIPLAADDTQGAGTDLGGGATSARNPLNFLNPNDIESISILKDASATAIYGSRGANGVVLITTKSGRKGSTGGKWEVNASFASATPANEFDLLNRNEYLAAIEQYGNNPDDRDFGFNTDWQDVITRHTISPIVDLSYSQNYGSGNVRASFGYQNQQGIMENSSQERITGRINFRQRLLDDKLKIDLNGTISRVDDETPFIGNTAPAQGDLIASAYFANPTWPNDPTFDPGGAELNPANLLESYQDIADTDRILVNGSVEYSILPNLTAKVALGYDASKGNRYQTLNASTVGINNGVPGFGKGAYSVVNTKNELLDATLNYTKEFENSNLELLLGYSYQSFQRYGNTAVGFGFDSSSHSRMRNQIDRTRGVVLGSVNGEYQQIIYAPNLSGMAVNRLFTDSQTGLNVPIGATLTSFTYDRFDYTDELQSFFTRANYTIANKYLFTATLRVDGSTRFGPNDKYGWFPSAAFAWKMHEEDFIGESVSTLKLRLGFGITGSQDGLGYGNYLFRQRYAGPGIQNSGNVDIPGLAIQSYPDADLKWEETTQYNFGIDYGFGNDRLNGSLDLYYKSTADLLLKSATAAPSPQEFNFSNIDASVINYGAEFSINYDVIQQDDLFWTAGFNISYNKNEVQDFQGQINTGEINGNGLTGAFAQVLTDGEPLFSYFLREFAGFDSNGISIYPNGDVQELVGKSALPTVNAGFNTTLTYKRWSLDAFLTGQFGQYIYNNSANAFFTAGIINGGKNVTKDVLTNGESPANAPDVSTRFLEKGDFIRMQTLSLAYQVPVEDGVFESFRISLTGQNLFVITDYSGLDPEVNINKPLNDLPSLGIDYTSFPRPRTITLGLSATF